MLLRIFTEPQQGATYDTLLARGPDRRGPGIRRFLPERPLPGHGRLGPGCPGPTDAWVTLAGIARETERIRLGTLVTSATFRLPGPLAISVAEVDAMSGGRVELGLGAGWYDAEHTAYGIPFPALGHRFERLEEQLAIVTGLWGTPDGERFTFEGDHYVVVDSPALPKPVQRPGPPIIVGGGGLRAHPAPGGHLRVGVQPGLPIAGRHRATSSSGSAAPARAPRRDPASLVYSAAQVVCCGEDDARDQPPGRRHRPRRRRAP